MVALPASRSGFVARLKVHTAPTWPRPSDNDDVRSVGDGPSARRRTRNDPSGTRWLLPAFPLDYVIDLVELVQLAIELGVPTDAISEAIEVIGSWLLPDGGWPMLGSRRLTDGYRPESLSRSRSSTIITSRVAALGPNWS